jgi:hypothetical protein
MGLLDKMKERATELADVAKERAGDLAGDASRAGKVAQAQLKLRSLQGDLDDANKRLGAVAYDLVQRGELAHAELAGPADEVRRAEAKVREKEDEIARLRAEGPSDAKPAQTDTEAAGDEAATAAGDEAEAQGAGDAGGEAGAPGDAGGEAGAPGDAAQPEKTPPTA